MYFACENKDQKWDNYISIGKEKSSAVDRRTKGQTEILYETRFWKNFIGFTCTYAIEYLDDVVFVPGM